MQELEPGPDFWWRAAVTARGKTMARKRIGRPPMKAVAKVKEVAPTTEQLSMDFEGRPIPGKKTPRAKAPRVREAPTGVDIPEKPKG
jgi:hypothetical protein